MARARRPVTPQPMAIPPYLPMGQPMSPPMPDWSPPPDYGVDSLPPDLAALLPPPVSPFHAQMPDMPNVQPSRWDYALAQLASVPQPRPNRSGDFSADAVAGLLRGLGNAALGRQNGRAQQSQMAMQQAAARNEANLKATQEQAAKRGQFVSGLVSRAAARADKTIPGEYLTMEDVTAANEAGIKLPQSAIGQPRSKYPQLANSYPKVVREPAASGGMTEGQQDLTPEAIDIYANERAATGTNKGVSVRDVKSIRAISNRMAKLYPGINLARNAAIFNANRGSLASMQKLHDGVQAFTSTADKNVQVLDEYATKLGGYDSPMANKTLRWFQANAQGKPELFAYNAARATVQTEYARILNTLAGSGQITDNARREMDSFIRGDLSLKAMREVLDVLRRDAQNRDSAYSDEIANISQRIGPPQNVPPTAAPQDSVLMQRGSKVKMVPRSQVETMRKLGAKEVAK